MPPSYSVEAFRIRLWQTNAKVILVEGPEDQRAIRFLVERHRAEKGGTARSVQVDTAAIVDLPPGAAHGNREKVEWCCEHIDSPKLYCFADREFRGFTIADEIRDEIEDHQVNGRLVWSRGHSIENYYFDAQILDPPLTYLAALSQVLAPALDLFKEVFPTLLQQIGALSLVGRELANLERIEASIQWSMFAIAGSKIEVNLAAWKTNLRAVNMSDDVIDKVTQTYERYISTVVAADLETVRWLCHGHIGMRIIWCAFAYCAYHASNQDDREPRQVLQTAAKLRAASCARSWVEQSISGQATFPQVLIQMLTPVGEYPHLAP
jgi:hypothetical protein